MADKSEREKETMVGLLPLLKHILNDLLMKMLLTLGRFVKRHLVCINIQMLLACIIAYIICKDSIRTCNIYLRYIEGYDIYVTRTEYLIMLPDELRSLGVVAIVHSNNTILGVVTREFWFLPYHGDTWLFPYTSKYYSNSFHNVTLKIPLLVTRINEALLLLIGLNTVSIIFQVTRIYRKDFLLCNRKT